MLVALVLAVVVFIVVKLLVGLVDPIARYQDVIALLVALLVFLSRSGFNL